MIRGWGLALVAVWFGVGCVSSPERQALPESVSVPEKWGSGSSGDTEAIWWDAFASAELTGLIEEALGGNPDLLALEARVAGALATARIAGADLYPSFSAGLDSARRKQNFIGFPIPGSASDVLTTRATTHGLSLNTSWEIDIWGRVRAGKRAAMADSEAARADWSMRRLSLAAQLSKAWVDAIALKQQLALAEASADLFSDTADMIKDRYERGLRSALDVRLSVNSVHGAKALVQEREQQFLAALQQLESLLGRYPGGRLEVPGELPTIEAGVAAGIPASVLERRPDLQAAERRLAAADQRIRESRAALLPRISLTGSTGTSTAEMQDLLDNDFSVWSLAGNLAQPLFQGGRLRAGVDRAKARAQEAAQEYVGVALQAFREVEFALASEVFLAERERFIREAAAESNAALTVAGRRYERGLEDLISVLESQRRSLSDATQVIDVHRARLVNRIDLYLALGGGIGPVAVPERAVAAR